MTGDRVAHYRIGEKLGAGGMGVVYSAVDTRLERPVALKFLPDAVTRDARAVERLHREAKAASSLNHPNIRTIFAFEEHEGQQFIAMELLEGQPLDHLIRGGPLPVSQVVNLALQVTDALESAHAHGIVHRDIKPANLFVTEGGIVKVLDFGLAKNDPVSSNGSATLGETTDARLTASGTTIGTAAYMSPEQVRGELADARSDLFSLGVVLYEMATGRQPFGGATLGLVLDGVLNREPAPPRDVVPGCPEALERIILTALQKDRSARYQSAAELGADLRRLRQDLDSSSVAPVATPISRGMASGRPRQRRWRVVTATTLLVLVVAAGAVAWLRVFPRRSYDPCIVIGEFASDTDTLDRGLVEFVLKRALSQVRDVAVYDQGEYDVALKLETSSHRSTVRKSGVWSWLQEIGRPRRSGPRLLVSAEIAPSLGNLAVTLRVVDRGHAGTEVLRYRGVSQLLGEGIDAIARLVATRYDTSGADRAATPLQGYRPASELLSDHLDAIRLFWKGREAWSHRDMNDAEHAVKQALEIDSSFALAHLLLAEIRVFQNQWLGARAEIASAQKQSSALIEADTLRIAALLARTSGLAADERRWLQKLIDLEPHRKEYVFELGESYFHTADAEAARRKYQEALLIDDRYAQAFNHLGYCYAWEGRHDRAEWAFTRYLDLDPSANAYDSLGDAYIHSGEYRKATDAKQKALSLDTNLYFATRSLALIDAFVGRFASADRTLATALGRQSSPTAEAWLYATQAFVAYQAGRLKPALDACARGLALMGSQRHDSPGDELLWLQGQIELAQARPGAATGALDELHKMISTGGITETNYKPALKFALHLSALVETAAHRRAEALAALDELRQIKQKLGYWSTPYDRAYFLDASGQVREVHRQAAEAEQDYREALAYNPHCALARFHLARLLAATNRGPEAGREMQVFLREWADADPTCPELRQASEILRQVR